jgi:hypothetical protein
LPPKGAVHTARDKGSSISALQSNNKTKALQDLRASSVEQPVGAGRINETNETHAVMADLLLPGLLIISGDVREGEMSPPL